MHDINQKVKILSALKDAWHSNEMESVIQLACIKNMWFTPKTITDSLTSITENMLSEEKIKNWLSNYTIHEVNKTIGLVTAGNIPLVGFQDVLCAFILNAPLQVKLSAKDEVLMKWTILFLKEKDANWKCEIVDRLANFDAVIATGSDQSNRYFEYYFKQHPHLLRRNRNSLAILNGKESKKELEGLSHDIFQFYGLGCRNVSKLLLPKNYDVKDLFPYFDNYLDYVNHHLYKDNYDYNRTLLLMNKEAHLANDFVIVKEDESLHSRLATIHYSFYEDETAVQDYLIANHKNIQVVLSKESTYWESIPFGQSQQVGLLDYADGVDTIQFLLSL